MLLSLDDQLAKIFNSIGASFYWEGVSGLPPEQDETVVEQRAEFIADIHQAYKDAGYITSEQVAKTQELVNQMANLAHDMVKQPVMVWNDPGKLSELMSGREWYDKFEGELARKSFKFMRFDTEISTMLTIIQDAAKRASGTQVTGEPE